MEVVLEIKQFFIKRRTLCNWSKIKNNLITKLLYANKNQNNSPTIAEIQLDKYSF